MKAALKEGRSHAIVAGGSIAGLMVAHVLSRHFSEVTIIEKDVVHRQPETRKGQPQTRHLHGLLPSGLKIMGTYFPGFEDEIVAHGARILDFAESMNWYTYGGYKKSFVLGVKGVAISRPLLEHLVRERVLALPNIHLVDNTHVKQLTTTHDKSKIAGVECEDRTTGETKTYHADLVVDCTGRGSHIPQWLEEAGYAAPLETEVKINVGYTTRIYKRDPVDSRGNTWIANTPEAPGSKRMGAAFAIEDNRWMVTVGGWHNDHAPLEEQGYREFVKTLQNPNIYDIVSTCEPLSDLMQYKFPVSTRKHYEQLKSFPEGLLVAGDAVSSFNPIYGQGMSSACLQAVALDNLLAEGHPPGKLAQRYFAKTSKVINNIWQLATGEDFRYPETAGKRPFGIDVINKYVAKVHRASIHDEAVCAAFLQVMALLKPPSILMSPKMIWKVLRAS